ncbi:MAG: hypothetical protein ABIM31_05750 [candidate division WOR-3 bacterium]
MILLKPVEFPGVTHDKALVFELGFGNGDFLLYLTKKYPEYLVVGAELANRYFLVAFRKLLSSGIENFMLYRGDGRTLFRFFVENNRVEAIYINFPDPWEKPSKEDRRLVSEASLKMYYSRLKLGGKIFISTDSDVLKEYIRTKLTQLSIKFEEKSRSPYGFISTKYEKKWLSLNKPVSYFIITKTDERVFDRPEWVSDSMPNFIFKLKNDSKDYQLKLRDILPLEYKEGGYFYRIDKVYAGDEEYLFRVIHAEPFLEQKYYISFGISGNKGSIQIDDKNGIIITKMVIKAVKRLSSLIYGLLGERVIFSNLGEDVL